jgi:hypothetical protein
VLILGELRYSEDLVAGTSSQVFKFADKANMHFSCQVKLSLKKNHEGGVCPASAPFSFERGRDFPETSVR